MAQVIWAKNALQDLENLVAYIASDAPAAASLVAQRLFDRVGLLAHQPLLGAWIPEDSTQTYREVRQGKYRIIYRVASEIVYVLSIYHGARLLDTNDLRDAE